MSTEGRGGQRLDSGTPHESALLLGEVSKGYLAPAFSTDTDSQPATKMGYRLA
jgi:hypothetical protein